MRIKYSTDIFNNKTTYKNGKKKGIEQGGKLKYGYSGGNCQIEELLTLVQKE